MPSSWVLDGPARSWRSNSPTKDSKSSRSSAAHGATRPTDFATTFAQDELRYMWRHHLFQNVTYDTLTVRNNTAQDALPMRHLGSFLLGTGVGSGGVHWNGQIWRFLPSDFRDAQSQ